MSRITVYTDSAEEGQLAGFNHGLVLRLLSLGHRVAFVHVPSSGSASEELRSAGAQHVWLRYDPRADFARAVTEAEEPGQIFDVVKPDLVVFVGSTLASNVAANHAAIKRKLRFVSFYRGCALSPMESRCLPVVRAQVRQARLVAAMTEDDARSMERVLGGNSGRVEVVDSVETALAFIAPLAPREITAADPAPHVQGIDCPNGDITVLIQTTNRPGMLKTALSSVAAQTARQRIRDVVVSENTAISAGSAAVCAEFADKLPVRFIHRIPQLLAMDHDRAMLGEKRQTRYAAVLHDDDWWTPEHLERSVGLICSLNAVACYSAFFEVNGESSPLRVDPNLMTWFGGGFQRLTEPWRLGAAQVLMSCLPGTPGRYSTLVARVDTLVESMSVFDLRNPFDNDRMLNVMFARKGAVAFSPLPGAFIRTHPEQGSRRFQSQEVVQRMYDTTVWLLENAASMKVDIAAELRSRFSVCPPADIPQISNMLNVPWVWLALRSMPNIPAPLAAAWSHLERAAQPRSGVAA